MLVYGLMSCRVLISIFITLTDVSSNAEDAKIDCSQTIWILTSNWGQTEIIKFSQIHAARLEEKMDDNGVGLAWLRTELVGKILRPLVMEKFTDVDYGEGTLQAIARRIKCFVPFLPFTEEEQRVVADSELRDRFNLYREPAVLPKGDKDGERIYGNLHLQHTDDLCEYAARLYDPMRGADSMSNVADSINGKFILKLNQLLSKSKLSVETHCRICSEDAPIKYGKVGYAAEPNFWAHYDADTNQEIITEQDPSNVATTLTVRQMAEIQGRASGVQDPPERHPVLQADNPFDE